MKRKALLALAVMGLLALPSYGQFGFGGGGTGMLLLNPGVQTELKLSDAQKADLKQVSDKLREDGAKGREAIEEGDREKAREIFKKAGADATMGLSKYKDKLNAAQAKRLKQLELQIEVRSAGLKAYEKDEVAKALKLTDKQKNSLADAIKDASTDVEEITKEIDKNDFGARRAAQKKIAGVHQKSVAKFQKAFTEDQKTAWKELTGAPFELTLPKKGKGRGKPKDDA